MADLLNFDVLLSAALFFVYGSICAVSIMFTFSMDNYKKLDDIINAKLLNTRIITPLEIEVDSLDRFLIRNHKICGPALMFLSLIDLKLSFNLVNILKLY